jgi:hypothetical protein
MFYGVGFYYTKRKERAEESGPPGPDSVGGFTKKYPPLISEFGISRVVPRLLILDTVRYASADLQHHLNVFSISVNACQE